MMEQMRWEASLRGIDLDKEIKKDKEGQKTMFPDPSSYEDMTPEERKKKTEEMIGKHKSMLGGPGGL